MANRWYDVIVPRFGRGSKHKNVSFLRTLVTGSLYRISDARSDTSYSDIQTQINTMRALARDSQISTALSYYATDATTTNSAGDIIWATPVDNNRKDVADNVNALLKRWKVASYARDHILELATIGNLYIPTTFMYRDDSKTFTRKGVVLDNNTIPEPDFDIIPSYKIPPETILHLFLRGDPQGYLMYSDDDVYNALILPEAAVIHFSLGGLLGDYTIETRDSDNNPVEYDIKFAQPLMERAVQPTQTLGLLEDSLLLASLARAVKFVNVECGSEEDEIEASLQEIKQVIEQQLSINTSTGDAQSFINPQSPNNLVYLPKINGQDAISITDLNMSDATEQDSKLLQYYQDKKLSVLGVPKEAMNFSSSEGLGGAGQVMSQRSALYANSLQRLETAYMTGWTDAINTYFMQRGLSGFVDQFQLHMNPIITQLSTIQGEKRDSALSQASQIVDVLKAMGVKDDKAYRAALKEILSEAFPQLGSEAVTWDVDINPEGEDSGDAF